MPLDPTTADLTEIPTNALIAALESRGLQGAFRPPPEFAPPKTVASDLSVSPEELLERVSDVGRTPAPPPPRDTDRSPESLVSMLPTRPDGLIESAALTNVLGRIAEGLDELKSDRDDARIWRKGTDERLERLERGVETATLKADGAEKHALRGANAWIELRDRETLAVTRFEQIREELGCPQENCLMRERMNQQPTLRAVAGIDPEIKGGE